MSETSSRTIIRSRGARPRAVSVPAMIALPPVTQVFVLARAVVAAEIAAVAAEPGRTRPLRSNRIGPSSTTRRDASNRWPTA